MSKASERVKRWRQRTKARMVESMGGECQCCGYNASLSALTFHHLDPSQKDMGFGETRGNPKRWLLIVEELRKCILLCMNCHAEIHAGVRQVPKRHKRFNESFVEYTIERS